MRDETLQKITELIMNDVAALPFMDLSRELLATIYTSFSNMNFTYRCQANKPYLAPPDFRELFDEAIKRHSKCPCCAQVVSADALEDMEFEFELKKETESLKIAEAVLSQSQLLSELSLATSEVPDSYVISR